MMTGNAGHGLEGTKQALRTQPATSAPSRIVLSEQETWSCKVSAGGLDVTCLSGQAWITVEGDPEDHLLVAGSTFSTLRKGRLLAIMAFCNSELRLRPVRFHGQSDGTA